MGFVLQHVPKSINHQDSKGTKQVGNAKRNELWNQYRNIWTDWRPKPSMLLINFNVPRIKDGIKRLVL